MSTSLKRALRPALRKVGAHPYHLYHRVEALRYLRSIETQNGRLEKSAKARCREYAGDVFKSRVYSPWLYVYAAMAGEFREGWIPDNYYGYVVVPKLKGQYGYISRLKPLNNVFFGSEHFPDVLSFVNNAFYSPCAGLIADKDVREFLFQDNQNVVMKLDNSLKGQGIHFFDRSNFDIDKVKSLGNGLFQSYLYQDDGLAEFSRSAVSTLRLTTVIDENSVPDVRASYLRLGTKMDSHVQSKSQVMIPVRLEDGRLNSIGYTAKWNEITCHPTSRKSFFDFSYPKFDEACEIVKNLHAKVPYVRCIGWDVCVDKSGKVNIIEWNGGHNDIKFSEATQGPCFSRLGWERLA